ncbi:unnamed protein product [Bursaphelenchus xylophilus]|uniref:(pine wood nematode) hypothetical protein n=1 Tax=Bursaphelenchus xylophilus TaxID=6326 RepID=A0A7I8XH00_BURXY|nr:unnamed protein product [Bursaphelenchus xylophilus]CAG9079784.1 unnamed protein product [Bursaphelenchus xylophilus]
MMYCGNNDTNGPRFFLVFGGTPPRPGMLPLQPPADRTSRSQKANNHLGPEFPFFRPPIFKRPLMNNFPIDCNSV